MRIHESAFRPALPIHPRIERPTYQIQRGDTLAGIAKTHHTTVEKLLAANPQIHHPDRIYPGDLLHLPPKETYVVHSGDTLAQIARRLDVPLEALIQANKIDNPDRIFPGDTLIVPDKQENLTLSEPKHLAVAPHRSNQAVPDHPPSNGLQKPAARLTQGQWQQAADRLGVDLNAIKAVAEVESNGKGFLPTGEPVILFEAHQFSRRTNHSHDASHPNNFSLKGNHALYQKGLTEHARLSEAMALDEAAALNSTSWGMFQIMGFNHKAAGFPTVQEFVNAMKTSESAQLEAFVHFIEANPKMHKALQRQDWTGFAAAYNGSGYAETKYDIKISSAYRRLSE